MSRPIALVTGASSGIGADLAREAARDGHDVILTARRVELLKTLAAELKQSGAKATIVAADLSQPGAAAELASKVGPVDVLINNAGLGRTGLFHESDPAKISETLAVNVVALTELTRLLLPAMVARRSGRVMLVASVAAYQPGPRMAVYYATKAYVLSLGEAIAFELRATGVTVTTVCPGPTATSFFEVAGMQHTGLASNPVLKLMTSAEVARLGYRGMKAGKPVVITGFGNKIGAASGRLSPKGLVLRITNYLNSDH